MTRLRKLHSVSFRAKVLTPVITVMVLLLAATVFVVNLQFKQQMFDNARSELQAAARRFQDEQVRHLKYLQKRFQSLANEPMYLAAFQTLNSKTVLDQLSRMTVYEALWDEDVDFVFFKPNQPRPADDLDPMIQQHDPLVSSRAIMAESDQAATLTLEGDSQTDTIRVGDKLYNVVSVPIYNPEHDRIIGALTFGEGVGWKVAQDFSVGARGLTALFAGGRVVASTLPGTESSAQLAARFEELAARSSATNSALERVVIGRENFFCLSGNFPSKKHDASLGYLLFSSYQPEMDRLQTTRLLLFAVSLIAILIGSAVVWFFVRRVTEPLRELRDSAEAVGLGDFTRRVPVRGNDECGELASVFNKMTANIEQSRAQLEKTVETLKTTQAQLIQSEKLSAVGEFVAGVAHELNNPLAAVMGFSEMLKDADVDVKYRRHLDMLHKASQRCQKIVQSLLSFARRHKPERKPVCVNKLVEDVMEIMGYQLRTGNIEVVTQLDPSLPLVLADEHQIQQVILNIVNNARQALEGNPSEGKIRITTGVSGHDVHIAIQDNGPGIPPENLRRIFDPFFTTKEVGKGTGLGLSLCYGIIKEHGGTITPSSKPGDGATFTIALPIFHMAGDTTKVLRLPETTARRTNDGNGKKILLIDDEEALLHMIGEELTSHGYEVGLAADGEAGLRQIKQTHFDLAFCDWKMPGVNGRQFYERLRADRPELCQRVIFITGDIMNEPMQKFLEQEKRPCLAKPFALAELQKIMKTALAAGQNP